MMTSDHSHSANSLLFVEDDALARHVTCKLISCGFPDLVIHQAENGQVGLDLFKEQRPNIVITDINMPVMNGIQMSREIKSISPDACIIAVTAYTNKDILDDIYEIGIAHCELKPLDCKRLFEVIKCCRASREPE